MITGTVTVDWQPVVTLTLIGSDGAQRTVNAVTDTGFNGFLTLPSELIGVLRWTAGQINLNTMADGSEVYMQEFDGNVLWDGRERDGVVLLADGRPLVGMELMNSYRLTVDAMVDGIVQLEAR